MTLKEFIKKLNQLDIDKYGDCQVYRPTGHWDGCLVESIEITDVTDDLTGETKNCVFIDVNYEN